MAYYQTVYTELYSCGDGPKTGVLMTAV